MNWQQIEIAIGSKCGEGGRAEKTRYRIALSGTAYGEVDPVTWRRARFRAVFHAAVVMVFANETGELQLVEDVTRALEWVL